MIKCEKKQVNISNFIPSGNGVGSVGEFFIGDVIGIINKNNLPVKDINLLMVSDWDLDGVCNIFKVGSNNDGSESVGGIVLNLNEVEDAKYGHKLTKAVEYFEANGFKDVTDYIGYETRRCFINTQNANGAKITSLMV